jgi:hypothetical protein
MSDFVGVVSDYIELESGRLPYTDDASLLRAFGGGGKRKGLEQEMIDAAPRGVPTAKKDAARQRASVQRQLQKWGLAGKAIGKKVVRGPLAKQKGFLQKRTRLLLRTILLRRRNAPTRIIISGTVCWDSGGSRECHRYHSTVEPVGERALCDIVKVAEVSANSMSGIQPPAGGGESGEEAATNILTGYWFDHDTAELRCDGALVAKQPYHDVMEYSDDVVFKVQRLHTRAVA